MGFIAENLAARILTEIRTTCRPAVVERGQVKTIWSTVLRMLLEEYRQTFHEDYNPGVGRCGKSKCC